MLPFRIYVKPFSLHLFHDLPGYSLVIFFLNPTYMTLVCFCVGFDFKFSNGCRAYPVRQMHGDIAYIEVKPHDTDKLSLTANTFGYFVNKVRHLKFSILHGSFIHVRDINIYVVLMNIYIYIHTYNNIYSYNIYIYIY